MRKLHDTYKVIPYSKLRRGLATMMRSAKRKSNIHGLFEVDVTNARKYLCEHKAQTGESLSFTAFIITCLSRAVDENKSLHAYHKGRKHLAIFDEVDVSTPIERDVASQKQPIIYIVRAANTKTFLEVHQEIRHAQVEAVEKTWEGWGFTFMPMLIFRNLLAYLLVVDGQVSSYSEEIWRNCRRNISRYVWQRCWVGYPNQ